MRISAPRPFAGNPGARREALSPVPACSLTRNRSPGTTMPRFARSSLAALALSLVGTTQAYQWTSEHLAEPGRLIAPIVQAADFWQGRIDPAFGGYFTNIERDGTPLNDEKITLPQSRVVYGAVRAFMVTGDERYLEDAEQALDFLYEHAWDREHEGWYNRLDREGRLIGDPQQGRSSFHEHYSLIGIVTYFEATHSARHGEWLAKARTANDRLWDERDEVSGYFHSASRDWSTRSGKSFTAEADAITSHLLFDYLTSRSPERAERLHAVANNLIDHLVAAMDHEDVKAIFPYGYDSDWNFDYSITCLDTGHMLKTAWHMTRLYLVFGEERYRKAADHILERFWTHQKGTGNALWNETAGLPRGRVFWGNGRVYQDTGVWWTLEQAVMAGLLAYHINGNERDLEIADRTMAFFMEHYWDHEYGDAYIHVAADGTPINDRKASAFHTIELLYCAYLYSNLYYHRQPVALFYRFEARDEAREIKLTPLAIPDDALMIAAVEWQGAPYQAFDPKTRTLQLEAGTGGVFRVTFERSKGLSPHRQSPHRH